jgi:hypothetical protein
VDDDPGVTAALLEATAAWAAALDVPAHLVRVVPPLLTAGSALAAREDLDRVARELWAAWGTPATSSLVTDPDVVRGILRSAARPGTLVVLGGAPSGRVLADVVAGSEAPVLVVPVSVLAVAAAPA